VKASPVLLCTGMRIAENRKWTKFPSVRKSYANAQVEGEHDHALALRDFFKAPKEFA